MMPPPRRAFTLIELLFVVAIIAILAAIAVPNFLEAQTRSKLARARADMDVISMGLARYYADQGAYPPNISQVQDYLEQALNEPDPDVLSDRLTSAPFQALTAEQQQALTTSTEEYEAQMFRGIPSNSIALRSLSTPLAYLDTVPRGDVFNAYYGKSRRSDYLYANMYDALANNTATTAPIANDGQRLTSNTLYMLGSCGPDAIYNFTHPIDGPWMPYDVTNGTMSEGDILRFNGAAPALPVVKSDAPGQVQ